MTKRALSGTPKSRRTCEFKAPEVLFDTGKTTLKPRFKAILDDFFPRYLRIIKRFRHAIDEIRIEGHTSSVWNRFTPPDEAYLLNMELSQGRTRSVLRYVYHLVPPGEDREWVKRHIAAVGLSSERPVLNPDGTENRERSRRVTFRILTNAEVQIMKILPQ